MLNLSFLSKSNSRTFFHGACFFAFSLLAVLHIPIYEINDKALGGFDLAVLCIAPLAIFGLARNKIPLRISYYKASFTCLVLFTIYAGFTLAINWSRPLLSLLPEENFSFPILLWAKQVEYLLIILSAVWLSQKTGWRSMQLSLSVSLIIISLYGFYAMFIGHFWYRLGLINMSGEVSSNPGGFVLGAINIFVNHCWIL